MSIRYLPTILFAGLFCGSLASAQESVTLSATADTTIFSEAEDSNGAGDYLFAGRTNNGADRRALIRFDLGDAIPAGATITEVSLRLTMNRTVSGAEDVSAHRVTSAWGEGPTDAPLQEGTGAPAEAGDATWTQAVFPDSAWNTAGGDFSATASATVAVAGNGTYFWIGDGMVADVQAWLDNPASNFGWILIGPAVNRSAKRFHSRDSFNTNGQPQLTIAYTSSAPETWAGFDIAEDGRSVNTMGWIGWIDIGEEPWLWSYDLNKYIYAEEAAVQPAGGWVYVPR